jgi:hypothetical protein
MAPKRTMEPARKRLVGKQSVLSPRERAKARSKEQRARRQKQWKDAKKDAVASGRVPKARTAFSLFVGEKRQEKGWVAMSGLAAEWKALVPEAKKTYEVRSSAQFQAQRDALLAVGLQKHKPRRRRPGLADGGAPEASGDGEASTWQHANARLQVGSYESFMSSSSVLGSGSYGVVYAGFHTRTRPDGLQRSAFSPCLSSVCPSAPSFCPSINTIISCLQR